MEPSNDNLSTADASRVLAILGRVEPDGRIRFVTASDTTPPAGELEWPNDPQEA